MAYLYSKKLQLPFEEVVKKVIANLHAQGFSMISSMDVKDTLKKNEDIEFRNYLILSVCHPQLSYKAITLEPNIGIVLPCHVLIQQRENGITEVSASNPMENMDLNMITTPLESVAAELSDRLRTAVDALQYKKSSTKFSYNLSN